MRFIFSTLLILSLSALAPARSTEASTPVCVDFVGSVNNLPGLNYSGKVLPYIGLNLSLRLATNPLDRGTLREICNNTEKTVPFPLVGLSCLTGYTARFAIQYPVPAFIPKRSSNSLETSPDTPVTSYNTSVASFSSPEFPEQNPEAIQVGFFLTSTVRADGTGTDYRGEFGCDGKNANFPAWTGAQNLLK